MLGENLLLDFLREGCGGSAGIEFARTFGNRERVADGEIEHALGADEAEGLRIGAFAATGFKVYAEVDLEARMRRSVRVLVHAGHQIRHVAAIFPVVSAAGGRDAVRTDAIHHEVNAGEEMNEEIAGNAGAVGSIVSPAEQANGLEGALGRAAEELIPIDGFAGRRRAEWYIAKRRATSCG